MLRRIGGVDLLGDDLALLIDDTDDGVHVLVQNPVRTIGRLVETLLCGVHKLTQINVFLIQDTLNMPRSSAFLLRASSTSASMVAICLSATYNVLPLAT